MTKDAVSLADLRECDPSNIMELYPEGQTLNQIICYFYLLDVSTVYLAVMNKVDPSKTKDIDYLKKVLKRIGLSGYTLSLVANLKEIM